MSTPACNPVLFGKVAIIGVGLIGGSLGLALRSKGLCTSIVGFGRSAENLERARERGIIDVVHTNRNAACEDADLVVLATPVGVLKETVEGIRGSLKPGAIVTDVASIKGKLVSDLEALLSPETSFVGGHPIAGGDRSGSENARPDLFAGALCIITPTEKTSRDAQERVIALWCSVGAKVELMDPIMHDEIYALVSHLPHLVAYCIVNTVDSVDGQYVNYAGRGFKDATRIAMSSTELWRDITMQNRDNLLRLIDLFRKHLDELRDAIDNRQAGQLEAIFTKARQLRMRLK